MPILIAIVLVIGAFPSAALAAPDLATMEVLGGLTIVGDRERPTVYYFFPGEIGVAERDDRGPDLAFSVARYTGTLVHGDQGERSIRPLFYARVKMAGHDPAVLRAARETLSRRNGSAVALRPIPIAKLEARLVYASARADDGADRVVGSGFFEPATAEGDRASMWSERDVFLLLDPETAQLVEEQLRSGSLGLTLSYAFFSRAWSGADAPGELTTVGDEAAAEALRDALGEPAAEASPQLVAIHANAVPIVIPEEFRASRIRRYDIDTTYPPDYPSLIAYCFDFRDGREDLFEKSIEVEAAGVAGGITRYIARFSSDTPEVTAQTIRFRFAVDLRQPYRWRVEEILMTGESVAGPWKTSESWSGVIDASGPIAPAIPD